MEHQKIFPTNIFIEDNFIDISKGPEYTDGCIHNMKKHIEKDWAKRDKNKRNFQTDSFLYSLKEFQPLADLILNKNLENMKTLEYNVKLEDLVMSGMWANVIAPGESHRAHTHSNNLLSGVYYLHSDQNAGITFQDPRPAADVLVPRKIKNNSVNSNLMEYASKMNRVIMFPSWLLHWVNVNTSTSNRISISWNIHLKGQLGEHHDLQSAIY
jgi:uncharacterized protein (TIGR02466 family)|tara:strand:- start:1187 stop:1822 length:636 start_codon:yes stop_codon:yes gene_type:complete